MNPSESSATVSSENRARESGSSGQSRNSPSSSAAQRPESAVDMRPSRDMLNYVRRYARQKPDVAALWCFGLGMIVGWKIKPW